MDRILKEHFDRHRENSTMPQELDGNKFGVSLFPDKEKLKEWRDNRKGLRYADSKSGVILMGAIDNLLITHERKYAPLDYKTRGYPLKDDTHEHYQHQMDIYSFLLEKNGMPSAGFAILLFYHPLRITSSCNVEFHAEPVQVRTSTETGEKLFIEAVKCLLGQEPEANRKCEWCASRIRSPHADGL